MADVSLVYVLPLINGCEIGRVVLHIPTNSLDDAEKAAEQLDKIITAAYNAGQKDGIKELQSKFQELAGLKYLKGMTDGTIYNLV